ncbi:hypothetical protein [Novosphingobium sp.]|uniref:hypothetical protein n=1 Tax=Novosphingobium sp. TaxID=1874826 RepID=UPI002635FC54|nr:hypothetical protein [Novosphingobium sp.]
MPQGIDQLYRTAIEKLAKSADADIEHLRRAVIRGDGVPLEPDPRLLAEASGKGADWGEYAFGELRAFGFIVADVARFVWYRPTKNEMWERQAVLAGIEATAIVRLVSMDRSPAVPEILKRLEAFERTAASGKALASLLAHQKLMVSVVAATGEVPTLEEYARRASVAQVYARAAALELTDIKGMTTSARTMVLLLCEGAARDCAAAATAMRIHPRQPAFAT